MAANKVILNGEILIDLTTDTVTAADLKQGKTAHDKTGAEITGTFAEETKPAVTPTGAQQEVTASAGKYLSKVTVNAVPTETKNITSNGTHTPSSGKYFSSVTVNVDDAPNLQTKEVTSGAEDVTVNPDSGYEGFSSVVVKAIPVKIESNSAGGTTYTIGG